MVWIKQLRRRMRDSLWYEPTILSMAWFILWLIFTLYDLHNANIKELNTLRHEAGTFVEKIESRFITAKSILTGFSAVLDLNKFSKETIQSLEYYVDKVAREHPEIWMIEVSKQITENERLPLIENMRALGYSDFSIRNFSYQDDRSWLNVPQKETYTPLIYAGPKQNLTDPIIGLDYESIDFIHQALVESITQKKVTTSKPFNLIEGPRAVALFFPLITDEKTIANLIILTEQLNLPNEWIAQQTYYALVYEGEAGASPDELILFSNDNLAHTTLNDTWLFPGESLAIPLTGSDLPITLFISHQTSLANFKSILLRDLSLAIISSLLLFLLLITKEKLRLSREKTNKQIADNEQKLRFALTGANAGYWDWDIQKGQIFRDMVSTHILGYDRESLVQQPEEWFETIYPEDRTFISKVFNELASGKKDDMSLEYRVFNKQGEVIWVMDKAKVTEFDHVGKPTRLTGIFMDITQKKELEIELEKQASVDFLTGALNRRAFMGKVEEEILRKARYPESLSLMMIDIDYFKRVNDTYGHQLGDKVLEFVSTVIVSNLRSIDIFGRIGGEEFAILMPETTLDDAYLASERIRTAVERLEIRIDGGESISVTISIGLTQQSSKHSSFNDLIKEADSCLYEAKHKGRNQTVRIKRVFDV